MPHLDDFIQQGLFPFVGREKELDELLRFWRGTAQSQRLRAAFVRAEAGVGKSRLLEEALRHIVDEGGGVVHAKLYPETSVSLAPLLADAIWHSSAGRELLRAEPEPHLSSVLGAIRRLCRLRPTLLVIEDAHLITGDSTADLAALVNALADETLSLLILCRPTEWRAWGVLEPFLVERIELAGLNEQAIGHLWQVVFESAGAPDVISRIHHVTLGNGLAVRSSFRMALDSGYVVRDHAGKSRQVVAAEPNFMRMLERSVDLLSEGMVMHLNGEELRAAARLASLGEAFARESAHLMLDDADRMIATLVDKGIISTSSVSATAHAGVPAFSKHHMRQTRYSHSAYPLLAFTHTLLHKHLVDGSPPDRARILQVVGEDKPLYSVLPIQLLKDIDASEIDREVLAPAVDRVITIARLIDTTSEWPSAFEIFEVAERLAERLDGDEESRRWWRARMWGTRLWFERRKLDNEARREKIERYLELTADPTTERLATQRFSALQEYIDVMVRVDYSLVDDVWNELDALVAYMPQMRSSIAYVGCLGQLVNVARQNVDNAMLERIQERVASILADDEIDEEFRRHTQIRTYPDYLLIFDSVEELEDRLRMLGSLEGLSRTADTSLEGRTIDFLMHIGEFDRMLAAVDAAIPRCYELGHTVTAFIYTLDKSVALAAYGEDLSSIASTLAERLAELPPARAAAMRRHTAEWMAGTGFVLDNVEWGREMMSLYSPDESKRAPVFRMLFDIADGEFARALEQFDADPKPNIVLDNAARGMIEPLLRMLVDPSTTDETTLLEGIRRWSERPPLRIWNVAMLHAMITLVEALASRDEHHDLVDRLRASIVDALRSRLEWLAERSLFAFMTPLVESRGDYLDANERTKWRQRIDAMRSERGAAHAADHDKVRVSMLGTISVGHGAELEPLRGVRIRTLLGLLVADQMIGRTLTPKEFVQIAGGGDDDNAELARKKRNMGVVRLREIMGQDAILTDEKTPRLNLDRVEVDLLRADELIKRSLAAAREGSLVRAHPLLVEALEVTRGEVPFPTLYETFFEAAREDFEYRLRSAIVDISQGLLREGDSRGAEEVLRRGFAAMPDDGEISELLQRALVSRGNRMEAERVRMKSEG